jgi:hypothetical protein
MPPTDKPVTRREFARRAALGTAGLLAYPRLDHDADIATNVPEISRDSGAPENGLQLSAPSQAESEARYQSILYQYPDRFSDSQKTDLKRLCAIIQPPLDRIRAYAISNGDLPALYLKPLVDRDKKPPASGKATTSSSPAAKPSIPGKP